jgi:hypothetical protein
MSLNGISVPKEVTTHPPIRSRASVISNLRLAVGLPLARFQFFLSLGF